jgi:hypothetical protein
MNYLWIKHGLRNKGTNVVFKSRKPAEVAKNTVLACYRKACGTGESTGRCCMAPGALGRRPNTMWFLHYNYKHMAMVKCPLGGPVKILGG